MSLERLARLWRGRAAVRLRLPGARPLSWLGLLGPGLIAANAGNDAGGIATYASVGARYGYALLWAMVVITLSLSVVQEMAARMGAVTGKGFADLVRENLGLRTTAFVMLTLLVANAGLVVSEFPASGRRPSCSGCRRSWSSRRWRCWSGGWSSAGRIRGSRRSSWR